MYANFLIGLREGLEAALIVSILVAYLVKSGHADRLRSIWLGVALAVAASLGFGAILTFTSNRLSFEGQELFGGTLSIVAVAFVTWMVFWMRRTARASVAELHGVAGHRPDRSAALRAGGDRVHRGRPGGFGNLVVLVVGHPGGRRDHAAAARRRARPAHRRRARLPLLQGGPSDQPVEVLHLDRGALLLVAAGVLAYGIHDLQEARVLPGLNNLAFDVSGTVPPDSWYGVLLRGTINFTPATTWLQASCLGDVPLSRRRSCSSAYREPSECPLPQNQKRPWQPLPPSSDPDPPAAHAAAVRPPFAFPKETFAARPAPVLAGRPCLLTAGCAADAEAENAVKVAVTATDDRCELDRADLPGGSTTFVVTNRGCKVTEIYVYGQDGDAFTKVISEVENIGPGTSRDLTVTLGGGTYEVACKPGQQGDGIRTKITSRRRHGTHTGP